MNRKRPLPLLVLLLSACTSAPPVVHTPPSKPVVTEPQPVVKQDYSAQQWLTMAKQANPEKQPSLLLRAAEAWQAENRCENSLKVLSVLLPSLTDADAKDRAHLLQAECLLILEQAELASESLAKVRLGVQYMARRLAVSAQLAEFSYQPLVAARDYAELASLNPAKEAELFSKIWTLLQKVDDRALSLPANGTTYLNPWLQLAAISRQLQGQRLQTALDDWKKRHPRLPLPQSVQQLASTTVTIPQSIAVILPMSGRLASQGEALREGILAAYFDNNQDDIQKNVKLNFFDSNQITEEDNQRIANEFDFVLGPLLKENIEPLLETLPADKPMLVLNRLDEPKALNNRYFYSLAPEDEAEQLATFLAQKGYVRPVVVSSDRQLFQRMAQSFSQHWRELVKQEPKSVSFSDNKSMRTAMENLLDVQHSKQRIEQVERLVKEEVHNFARNRRDVDAIVIFATPGQTELLNPIIESSISPFASMVPVFATSRSYSQELGANSLRDLRNLTFLDMPWMLPGDDSPLKAQSQSLWPNRNDGQSRLFAMGYDAYGLIPLLPRLAAIEGMQKQGLTGRLKMDSFGQIHRELPMGKVSQEKVIRLAMD
ncbi:penicillin-binding protein activator [Aliiglaciecola sp. CAU 1673]|uniref:penicillin-binding protein activator n=1 Tax=Aliiglaciecola sp. CAU 1673 TaxID=3032595 RepID=UPI0023DB5EBE|nr:penicillin-binding protein activator [Aliiglaciecola sp. CAU 1673]MDF2178449.1 penicillin-binding protein activator [Aliiglaciecola sp. CAU 1673]